MEKFSYLKSINIEYLDDLFKKYLKDPASVEVSWRAFFEGLEMGFEASPEVAHLTNGHTNGHTGGAGGGADFAAEVRVYQLILAYREFGKMIAQVDPLHPAPTTCPQLDLTKYGLSTADLERNFAAGNLIGMGGAKLKDIIARLQSIYCGSMAVEIDHIQNTEIRDWILQKLENRKDSDLSNETRKQILKRLTQAETFERFLHTRYVAQKRFSVEGSEAVITGIDCAVETGAELGAKEFVMGMAHRGRLTTLVHVFGKKPEYVFTEFEGKYAIDPALGEGDVKYHKGYSTDITTQKGKNVHLSLAFNPSHLEFVNAVVEGMVRAKQDRYKDRSRETVMPILIHGDAAFAGQGVCYETLNLSQLPGYRTGGTLHIIINNLVGFTATADETRSTPYCSDLARILDGPIFHVNGDDPEAMWFAMKICAEFRQKFQTDAFIDLVSYRKHGHNEGDEPSFTSPLLYKKIKAHPSPREVYSQRLQAAGVVTAAEAQAWIDDETNKLINAQNITREKNPQPHTSKFEGFWKGYIQPGDDDIFKPVKTAVEEKTLKTLSTKINTMPAGFNLHSKLTRFFEAREKAIQDGHGIDWGNAEALAYATLVTEGNPVRLSGQDAGRGTFTHRHAILHDFETDETYIPLAEISDKQAAFRVYNSHLSETGVMGFEFGYSLSDPSSLVIWEAQFGDFANGAQVIIDQFIASTESKWQRMNGVTLLLPHGYEGQGPEHSSARLERFLTLAGRNNMYVTYPSTPAQIFHLLRRQVKTPFRKPLVVMTPKSLLRNPLAVSKLDELSAGRFNEVLDDPEFKSDAKKAKKVLICSGKVYYDLFHARAESKKMETAIVRVEQLYPFPEAQLAEILNRYSAKEFVWVQEEPRNMGAWTYIFNMWNGGLADFGKKVGLRPIRYVGRDIGAAPAVGSAKWHEMEQKTLVGKAFEG